MVFKLIFKGEKTNLTDRYLISNRVLNKLIPDGLAFKRF